MNQKIAFVELLSDNNLFKYFKLPNIGIIYLATILKNKGYETKVFSEQYKKIFNSKTKEIYKPLLKYDIIGFNLTTASSIKTYEMMKNIKKQKPHIKILIGGAHATFMPNEALDYCDYVIKGEAEEIIEDLIQGKIKSKIVNGKPVENLDKLPIPDFDLVDGIKPYLKVTPTPISTSRGCPFACNFCSVTKMFGRKYRFRTAESLLKEIKFRYEKGLRRFFFYDDNFAANKNRIKELLKKILESKMDITWGGQARTDIAKDEELIDLMKKTKCNFVLVGFESINQESLDSMNKKQSLKDIEEFIKVFNEKDIYIHGAFIFGNEKDTLATFDNILKFCEKNNIYSAQFTTLTPLPGSELYSELEKKNKILTKDWSLYDTTHVVIEPKNMTSKELQKGLMKLWKRFYSFKQGIKYEINKLFKHKKKFNIRKILKRFILIILLKLTFRDYDKKNEY
jgi:radical SAM superfamily enzyme YgiQ (UPF0313 family)